LILFSIFGRINNANMKKMLFTAVLMMLTFVSLVVAQSEYKSAAGLRVGAYTYANLSYKTFISQAGALEVVAGFGGYGRGILLNSYTRLGGALLYQHHFDIPNLNVSGLKAYIGGGGLAGINLYRFGTNIFELGGVVGAGLDYKFEELPLNISIDFYPGLRILPDIRLISFGGISVRYTIN
jgi:hypothetical protein